MTGAKNFTGIFQTKAAAAMPQCSNGRKKVQLWKVIPFIFEGIFTTASLRLTLVSNIKVGHLLSKSKSKLVIEVCDQILLSKVIGKVSESDRIRVYFTFTNCKTFPFLKYCACIYHQNSFLYCIWEAF